MADIITDFAAGDKLDVTTTTLSSKVWWENDTDSDSNGTNDLILYASADKKQILAVNLDYTMTRLPVFLKIQ